MSVNLTRIISLWRITYLAHSSDVVEILILKDMSRSEGEAYLFSMYLLHQKSRIDVVVVLKPNRV